MTSYEEINKLEHYAGDAEAGSVISPATRSLENIDDAVTKEVLSVSVSDVYRLKSKLISKALSEIGMGRYQWELFAVTGFGWVTNNLMTQGLSTALTPTSLEFNLERASYATVAYYIGLGIGALFWGTISDVIGRRPSFDITLFITGIFCVATAGASNFVTFAALWACVGIGSGGNVPVSALVFLEFVPTSHQWLLTVLSAWWCFGQVVAGLVGWVFLAHFSCPKDAIEGECRRSENMGWRYTLITMGLLTLSFAIGRILFFKLPESPRYLLSMGRDADVVAALNFIAVRNGKPMPLTLADLEAIDREIGMSVTLSEEKPRSSILERIKGSLAEYKGDHIRALFSSRKMGFHCIILWTIWVTIGIAYPLYFNFIPSYLTAKFTSTNSLDFTYKKFCIVSAVGVAGPIAAGFLIETRLGRRWMMVISFFFTGLFLFLYTTAKDEAADLGFQCATGVLANFSYAILYAYTPESFPVSHRGTGSGIANSLQFLCGILAPIISANTGFTTVPIYASAGMWCLCGALACLLPFETHNNATIY